MNHLAFASTINLKRDSNEATHCKNGSKCGVSWESSKAGTPAPYSALKRVDSQLRPHHLRVRFTYYPVVFRHSSDSRRKGGGTENSSEALFTATLYHFWSSPLLRSSMRQIVTRADSPWGEIEWPDNEVCQISKWSMLCDRGVRPAPERVEDGGFIPISHFWT